MSDDGWGCFVAIVLLLGGAWLFNHYEIKSKTNVPNVQLVPSADSKPPRPTGMQPVTETKDGSVWRLNADSVRGDRRHRQGWVIVDASKDKTVTNWRFAHVLYLVDCDTTAARELSRIFYDAKGETPWPAESWDPAEVKPEYYPEGTVGYAPVRALCDEGFDTAKSQ
jgi:hypothetical protein